MEKRFGAPALESRCAEADMHAHMGSGGMTALGFAILNMMGLTPFPPLGSGSRRDGPSEGGSGDPIIDGELR